MPTATGHQLNPPVADRDHIRGTRAAQVTLTEYGDYECPYCLQAHLVLIDIMEELGSHVRLCFRNFPLATAHPHAQQAAEAAEAAGAQGKFWEMHDVLYENQRHLEYEDLVLYAKELGLDAKRFAHDMKEHTYAERVREDFLSGVRSGVNGTPTFFINGTRHDGPWDLPDLTAAIQAELEALAVRGRK